HFEYGRRVHVREEPPIAASAQDTWRQQPGGDGAGAPEGGGEVDRHAEPDGSAAAVVPPTLRWRATAGPGDASPGRTKDRRVGVPAVDERRSRASGAPDSA